MRKLIILIAGIALLVLVPTAGSASPPLAVSFEVPTTGSGDISYGPFTASGAAVDDGLVCPAGETIDVAGGAAGFQSERLLAIQLVKQFTCDDGSGEFYVKLQVLINQNGDNFQWAIVDGTGAYERLHGTGKGIGLYPTGPAGYDVLDLYSGKVHSD
jgi:hypothetical protein